MYSNELNVYDYINRFPHFPSKDMLDLIEGLSSQTYEKSECSNKIIVFLPPKISITFDVPLAEDSRIPFEINTDSEEDYGEKLKQKTKEIRKLINPVPPDSCFVFLKSDDGKYYASGSIALKNLKKQCPTYYLVNFSTRMIWTISLHNSNDEIALFQSKYGHHHKIVPNEKTEVDIFNSKFEGVANKLKKSPAKIVIPKRIMLSIKKAVKAVHTITNLEKCGTSFVIFFNRDDAKFEAERLSKVSGGYLLSPEQSIFGTNSLKQIINIDGGLILDSEGNCYAYGCIYDGVADTENGFYCDNSHGARHNSMLKYTYYHNYHNINKLKPCIGVVFSEDGGITPYYGMP